ncbi:MAG: TIGR02996 domain-containing protein [Gemmataceae bacterium]|nr:TIGR02996 domain-containing protein [Gemmataceae bacterium]
MTEREAFIHGIAANPYDDTARLAFADWLDEHGEHPRAEFIRVQVELEPIRDKYEIPRAAELHKRENELWNAHHNQWSGYAEFRRGFPDIYHNSAKGFIEFGPDARAASPTIRRAVIYCLNGWGKRLAACEALEGLAELELACWYANADLKALAASPHLSKLQVLVLWMGSSEATLCRLAVQGAAWPNLRELVLFDPEGSNEKGIKKRVASINRSAKRELARYERGYPELFPLNGCVWSDFPMAGRLADGRAAVLDWDVSPDTPHGAPLTGLHVRTFDAAGAPAEELRLPLPPELAGARFCENWNWDERHTQVARAALGFEPGFIRVREDALELDGGWGPVRGHSDDWDLCGCADPENPTDYHGRPDPTGAGGTIYTLIHSGQFVIENDAWADKRGRVHST